MPTRAINRTFVFDADTRLQDAVALTASQVGEIATVAQVVDLGDGYDEPVMVIDVSAMDLTTGDEDYSMILQVSADLAFTNPIDRARIDLGNAASGDDIALTGTSDRFWVHLSNQVGDTVYRYARLNIIIAGTTPSITMEAYLTKFATVN